MEKEKRVKIKSVLSNISLAFAFISVALLVLGIFGVFQLGQTFFKVLTVIVVVAVTLATAIPWAERLSDKRVNKLAVVFLAIIGVCLILWVLAVFLAFHLIDTLALGTAGDEGMILFTLQYFKACLIITVWFINSSLVAGAFAGFGKQKMVLQIVNAVCNLIIAVWLTMLALSLDFRTAQGGYEPFINTELISFAFGKTALIIVLIAFLYRLLSGFIINNVAKRKAVRVDESETRQEENEKSAPQSGSEGELTEVKSKLLQLKALFDEGIITEEEYEIKRKDLLMEF